MKYSNVKTKFENVTKLLGERCLDKKKTKTLEHLC